MTKKTVITIIVALVALGGIVGAFFALSSSQEQTAQKIEELEVLDVKDERMVIGDTDNQIPIVEYADILCPYCALAHHEILPKIKDEYIDTGKAYYEMRLVGVIRPESQLAAEGAYCAAEQDKFWDYIDRAYRETWDDYYSKDMSPEEIPIFREGEIDKFADRAGIDLYPWKQCIEGGTYKQTIDSNKNTMTSLDGYGTPFFLFNEVPYGSGTPEYSVFKGAIDAEYRRSMEDS